MKGTEILEGTLMAAAVAGLPLLMGAMGAEIKAKEDKGIELTRADKAKKNYVYGYWNMVAEFTQERKLKDIEVKEAELEALRASLLPLLDKKGDRE